MSEWQPEDTAPENVVVQTCQDVFGAIAGKSRVQPSPMVMSRQGGLWFWEPEHWAASVVPTHWRPLPVTSEIVERVAKRLADYLSPITLDDGCRQMACEAIDAALSEEAGAEAPARVR
jgi:hypothetical protein